MHRYTGSTFAYTQIDSSHCQYALIRLQRLMGLRTRTEPRTCNSVEFSEALGHITSIPVPDLASSRPLSILCGSYYLDSVVSSLMSHGTAPLPKDTNNRFLYIFLVWSEPPSWVLPYSPELITSPVVWPLVLLLSSRKRPYPRSLVIGSPTSVQICFGILHSSLSVRFLSWLSLPALASCLAFSKSSLKSPAACSMVSGRTYSSEGYDKRTPSDFPTAS